MENILSWLFYLLFLGALMLFCRGSASETSQRRNVIIAYILFFIVSAIRFGLGNDYWGYAPYCNIMAVWFQSGRSLAEGMVYYGENTEYAHIFICWLVKWMSVPYVGLFIVYSIIQTLLLYFILQRSKEHFWGLFLFIVGEFMFCSWDAVRQFTAVLILLYSYDFVKNGKFLYFLLCVALAWCFHRSAIYTLPIFLLRWVKVNRWVLVAILGAVTILAVSGVIQPYQERLSSYFELSDYYSGYGSNAAFTVVATSLQYRIRLLLVGVIYSLILIYYPKGDPLNELLLTIGASLFIFANNGLSLMRISWYFWIVSILMIGPSIQEMSKKNLKWVYSMMIVVLMFIFSHDVIEGTNVRGCEYYTTIFTNDLYNVHYK